MAPSISKFRRGDVYQEDDDRISRLPLAILGLILSLMPTKDAVRTSILSKRWIRVWTAVPNIDISDSLLLSSDSTKIIDPGIQIAFMNFVERVLDLNDISYLQKFSLNCTKRYDLRRVGLWIKKVMMREMVEIDLGLSKEVLVEEIQHLEFPRVFKNLVVLKLRNWDHIILNVPQSAHLPNLKILHLQLIKFVDKDSVNNLIGGCPVLEELDIEIFSRHCENTLLIRSTSLKSLRLHTSYFCTTQRTIVVDAKNLERLDLKVDKAIQYDLSNFSSLVEVKLNHCYRCSGRGVDGVKLLELLKTFSNTKYLNLSCYIMNSLEYTNLNNLPVFHNLNHLELKMLEFSWTVLPYLFQSSPNLSTFVLHKEWSHERPSLFRTPDCLMLNLQEIKMTGFKGTLNEMEIVKYFLNTAAFLKKFSIESYFAGAKKQADILKELIMFPRLRACQYTPSVLNEMRYLIGDGGTNARSMCQKI